MLGYHQLKAIQALITDLIPASNVKYGQRYIRDFNSIEGRKVLTCTGEYAGISEIENGFKFWIQNNKANTLDIFEIERVQISFTKRERRVIYALPEVCRSLTIDDDNNTVFTHKSISSQFGIPYILVSHFMRGVNHSCVWSSIIGLVLLQKLSYKKYEGNPCSSGFVCLKNISPIQQRIDLQSIYKFEPFSKPISLNLSFFEKPLSYRYVDGKNSFYVIDNHELVHGILRSSDPKQFDIISRSTFRHIDVLTSIPGFRWLAYSGFHNDIIVRTKKQMTFQWDKDIWRMRELLLLKNTLIAYGADEVFAYDLVDVLYTLSELRLGALILITDDENMPNIIGKIDTTELGLELFKTMKGCTLQYLRTINSALGLLSSDGLTSFNKLGYLLDSGAIIDLSTIEKSEKISGGGRSQAAIAVSKYGLSIKVSEDGPITIYSNCKKVLEWK